MIRLSGLEVERPGFHLGPITFELPGGSHLGVIGPSGHGKTTLLWAIAGAVHSTGAVEVNGRRVERLPPESRSLSMAPQGGLLFNHLTVAQNIRFGDASADAQQLAQRFGCADLLARYPRSLSGGQRMRVSLARAVAHRSAVLLLDEPLAGLDEIARATLLPLLSSLAPERTLVHVTHGLDEAARACSHLLVLHDGQVAAFGTTSDVMGRPLPAGLDRWLRT